MASTAGSLTVTTPQGGVGTNKFTVKVSRNLTITNYSGRGMGEAGDIKSSIYNGTSRTDRIDSDGKKNNNLASMDLRRTRYNIMDAIRKLDGNADDLTEQDLSLTGKLDKTALGIKNIKRDFNAGVTTIECNDGAVLRFDFETDAEMQTRKKNEAAKAQKAKQAKHQAEMKKQQEKVELHEACKSVFQKGVEAIVDFIKGFLTK